MFDILPVVVPALAGLVFLVGIGLAFPSWLQRFAWYRCTENWLLYRQWSSCAHASLVLRRPVDATGTDTDMLEARCSACGLVLIVDTVAHWDAEAHKVSPWSRLARTGRREA
jgi:hypothetical protein